WRFPLSTIVSRYLLPPNVNAMPDPRFHGLFFPYANIESSKTLNTAVLYFDRITIIDPRSSFCAVGRKMKDLDADAVRYDESTRSLIRRGLLDFVDPATIVSEFGDAILAGVRNDVRDPAFLEVCSAFVRDTWTLSSAKI